jgi:hypothetical protein
MGVYLNVRIIFAPPPPFLMFICKRTFSGPPFLFFRKKVFLGPCELVQYTVLLTTCKALEHVAHR